jgi:hypothetical protein
MSARTGLAAKKAKAGPREHWKNEPDAHDFPAANDYLTLLVAESEAAAIVEALRRADPGGVAAACGTHTRS